jgi:hypothetical protein
MKVDLAHLLASRDQELRALSAEVMSYFSNYKIKEQDKMKEIISLYLPCHSTYINSIWHDEFFFQMNQVQADLRVARSVIAERDAEITRIRSVNNQVITNLASKKYLHK